MIDSREKAKKVLCLFLVFCVLFFLMECYYFRESKDSIFQKASEALAVGPMIAEQNGLEADGHGFFLGRIWFGDNRLLTEINGNEASVLANGYSYIPYTSQIGIQGIVYRWVAGLIPGPAAEQLLHLACMAGLSFFLLCICWQICKRYDFVFAACFLGVSVLSPWLSKFAGSMYWLSFLWFIPMLLGLLALNHPRLRWVIVPLYFLAVFVKCLCGYEYVSSVMMAGILFPAAEWLFRKEERKKLTGLLIAIGLACLLGFFAALLIHAWLYGGGDVGQGLALLKVELIERRTYGNAENYDEEFSEAMNASVFATLKLYFWGSTHGKSMLLVLLLTAGCLAYQKWGQKKDCRFEGSLFLVSVLAPLSWFVLAKAHSYFHPHINPVLWYLGWVQICAYILVRFLMENRLISKNFRLLYAQEDSMERSLK